MAEASFNLHFDERELPRSTTTQKRTVQAACILKWKLSYVTEIILRNIKQNMQMKATKCMHGSFVEKASIEDNKSSLLGTT